MAETARHPLVERLVTDLGLPEVCAADVDAFQDVKRHRFFNTNNLWVDLRRLAEVLRERAGVLPLDDRFAIPAGA